MNFFIAFLSAIVLLGFQFDFTLGEDINCYNCNVEEGDCTAEPGSKNEPCNTETHACSVLYLDNKLSSRGCDLRTLGVIRNSCQEGEGWDRRKKRETDERIRSDYKRKKLRKSNYDHHIKKHHGEGRSLVHHKNLPTKSSGENTGTILQGNTGTGIDSGIASGGKKKYCLCVKDLCNGGTEAGAHNNTGDTSHDSGEKPPQQRPETSPDDGEDSPAPAPPPEGEENSPAPAPPPEGEENSPAPAPPPEGEENSPAPAPPPEGEENSPAPAPPPEGEENSPAPAPPPEGEENSPAPAPPPEGEENSPAPAPEEE